jgi:hypothetical protein
LYLVGGADPSVRRRLLIGLQHQPLDTAALDEVPLHDLVDVFGRFVVVPDALGVDDHVRTEFAAIETARGVGANVLDAGRARLLAQIGAQLIDTPTGRGAGHAAAARMTFRPHVGAHEDMPRVEELRIAGCVCHCLSPGLVGAAERMTQTAVLG